MARSGAFEESPKLHVPFLAFEASDTPEVVKGMDLYRGNSAITPKKNFIPVEPSSLRLCYKDRKKINRFMMLG
ncbi:MAG: hypothetical protein K2M62_04065 [Muribaculaceae bacterium]|nr:hypothetical protein [Muribaculaceae bacterium]